jgi:hypothetical protein
MILLMACGGEPAGPASIDTGTAPHEVTEYDLSWSTDPDPLEAGEQGTFTIQVADQHGHAIDDLQQNHDRMVHTMFVSADWTSFSHLHHEDFADLTVEDLRAATFQFPITLPVAGPYLMMFGYAHQNQWLFAEDVLQVGGGPEQAVSPDTTVNTEVLLEGLLVKLNWAGEPNAGYESSWTVTITETDGTPVVDLVQYLGADAQ